VLHRGSFPLRPGPSRRLRAAGLLLLTSCLLGTTIAVSPTASATTALRVPNKSPAVAPAAEGTFRITQANLLSGQPVDRFQADVRTVLSNDPDFITYNEVAYRKDSVLAPSGYALFRTPGFYKGANPVAWNTDRWTAIAQGTINVCYKKGRLPWQKVHWGIRYASWATLQGVDGRVISVISAHLPPKTSITEGLQTRGLKRIGALANTLSASGPVLMAGDMNFHYGPRQYPRELLASYGFTSTYDVLGASFPTGDHHGYTIDYVFLKDTTDLTVHAQYSQELYSDHDAVTADLSFTDAVAPVSFTPGTYTNLPSGDGPSKRAVLDLVVKAVDSTPSGATIHLTTSKLGDKQLSRALKAAHDRKVHVQVITRRARPSTQEQALRALLGNKVWQKSWAVGCWAACRAIEARGNLPETRLLISQSGLTRALRIDADVPMVYTTARTLSTARVWTTQRSYDGAFTRFFRLVGRTV
jgi:endonuclease/exonuclease/phosphatase (EEP) superfamily protein YafD